jgi:serine/threonine protein kinase
VLQHPNIIELHQVIRLDGVLYLVYEYMDRSLLDYLEQVPLSQRSGRDMRNIRQRPRPGTLCAAS